MGEDSFLIQQIQQGDEEAMELLVRRYYDEIFYYIYRLGKSYEEAKDLTQEVFLAMLQALPTYKEQGNFKAWLYKIAYHRTLNFLQRYRPTLPFFNEHGGQDEGYLDERVANEFYISELLHTLPDHQRHAIILRYYNGFTVKEIAKIMDTPLSTTKSRIFQALQKLKKQIEQQGGGRIE